MLNPWNRDYIWKGWSCHGGHGLSCGVSWWQIALLIGGTKPAAATHTGNSTVYCCLGAATAVDRVEDETTSRSALESPTRAEKIYPQSGVQMCQARNGKKWERERNGKGTHSFLSRSSIFGHPFFSCFWPKSWKTGEKRGRTAKKRQERCGMAKNGRSTPFQIVEFGEIPFFIPFKTRFGPRSNPFFTPVPTRFLPRFFPFLPLSFPVLVPFLYCLAIISWYAPVAAQPLDHVGPSLVCGTSGWYIKSHAATPDLPYYCTGTNLMIIPRSSPISSLAP